MIEPNSWIFEHREIVEGLLLFFSATRNADKKCANKL